MPRIENAGISRSSAIVCSVSLNDGVWIAPANKPSNVDLSTANSSASSMA